MRRNAERSVKALLEAFGQLLRVKPIGKITVTDVSKRANLTRNTFYSYFSSIEDLRASYFRHSYVFVDYLRQRHVTVDAEHLEDFVSAATDYIYDHHEEYHVLLEAFDGTPNLRYIVMSFIRGVYSSFVGEASTSENPMSEHDRRVVYYAVFVAYILMYQSVLDDLDVPRDEFEQRFLAMVRPYAELQRLNMATPEALDPLDLATMPRMPETVDLYAGRHSGTQEGDGDDVSASTLTAMADDAASFVFTGHPGLDDEILKQVLFDDVIRGGRAGDAGGVDDLGVAGITTPGDVASDSADADAMPASDGAGLHSARPSHGSVGEQPARQSSVLDGLGINVVGSVPTPPPGGWRAYDERPSSRTVGRHTHDGKGHDDMRRDGRGDGDASGDGANRV